MKTSSFLIANLVILVSDNSQHPAYVTFTTFVSIGLRHRSKDGGGLARSGNVSVTIIVVVLRLARLILGWVTICEWVMHGM